LWRVMNLGITSHSVLLSDVAWRMGVYNDMYMHTYVCSGTEITHSC
jgi:hypothetical protein